MSRHQFRFLVVLNQLLILATLVVQESTSGSLPGEVRIYMDLDHSVLDPPVLFTDIPYSLWITSILIGLVAAIGLCLEQRWARTLYVASLLMALLPAAFSDFYFDTGWTVFVGGLAATTDGMILALLYFSPIRRMFKKREIDNEVDEKEIIDSI